MKSLEKYKFGENVVSKNWAHFAKSGFSVFQMVEFQRKLNLYLLTALRLNLVKILKALLQPDTHMHSLILTFQQISLIRKALPVKD